MGQRVRVHEVRVGGGEFRVVRPEPAPGRLVLLDDHHWLSMYADREGAAALVDLWALAARSARSLVYLPIRANPVPEGAAGEGEPIALDVVLVHHSLQFPTAAWKRVRAGLGAGRPQTTATPERDFPDPDAIDYERRGHRAFRDHLDFAVAAHTLFVVGSAPAFREHGTTLRGLLDEAPASAHRDPGPGHFCVELTPGTWSRPRNRRNVPGRLHIQYAASWRL
ncbi:hypothetical protein [Kitasatospora camelliae]|uniref:Uncharacterized protein n=1 Tax=Kitasatospora camelliae TaxID=3156397 RepID=A0AAU8JQM6_9ACTN